MEIYICLHWGRIGLEDVPGLEQRDRAPPVNCTTDNTRFNSPYPQKMTEIASGGNEHKVVFFDR